MYVHTIVISAQHNENVSLDQLKSDLMEHVIGAVIDKRMLIPETIYHLNPSGRFVIGGPQSDAGLTGRKIIVDTYGGWGAHGGGAFSGKDSTKVDRSAAYAARWVAKSLVSEGLCRRVLVQVCDWWTRISLILTDATKLSYAIGIAAPLSIYVNSYNSGVKTDTELLDIVNRNFDLRPGVIMRLGSCSVCVSL